MFHSLLLYYTGCLTFVYFPFLRFPSVRCHRLSLLLKQAPYRLRRLLPQLLQNQPQFLSFQIRTGAVLSLHSYDVIVLSQMCIRDSCNNILAGLTPELKLTAAADLRQSRRDWAKETLPDDVVLFENGDQLIESGLCDAVIIATPHYEHPRLAILAFEHGLHVMSEKPAGVYTKQVREMNEAAIRSGKVFGMMFNQRTNCVYRKMHEMVQSGKYGQIKRVNWIITDWYRTQAYYNSCLLYTSRCV